MSEELVSKQLSRLSGLMHPERTRIALEKADPERAPEELGALAGVGYRSHNPDIRVSVYIFSSWSQHQPISKQLKEEFAADGVHVVTATNGPMLFFGHTRTDGPKGMDARFALGDIVSAFSGDE
jgi:hypothetical protein